MSESRDKLTPEQADRLWTYERSEEQIFNDRHNFFLLLESLLLGVLAAFFGQSGLGPNREFILRVLLLLGLVMTLIWAYVSARQRYVLEVVRKKAHENLPEYAETEREIEKRRWPIRVRTLLGHVIPVVFVMVWIALQFAV